MNADTCLVITSISHSENPVLKQYAQGCLGSGSGFILAGDVKSPEGFAIRGCEFLSIARQKELPFQLAGLLPDNTYAKKNLAYLQAIKKGYKIIAETDDDNLPMEDFWQARKADIQGAWASNSSWTNVYRFYSDAHIWPRGFSLDHIKDPLPGTTATDGSVFCPIQQGLVDEDPDVDAIYRLTGRLPLYFQKKEALVLDQNSICPFNSQNTTWFSEAFALLYLPSYCSFRATDIWRSFIAQRILWTCGWHLSFHHATVIQKRNDHNLLKDFEQELSNYLHSDAVVNGLCGLDLKSGAANIPENLMHCYRWMISKKFIGEQELPLIEAWLQDLAELM